MRSSQGDLRLRPRCIDWGIAKSAHQGLSLRFPCNDRTPPRLISYLFYGIFRVSLKKNTIKTPGVIFHIRLGTQDGSSSSLILKKYIHARFSFRYWKYSRTLCMFFVVVVFAHALVTFTHNSKEPSSREKFHDSRSLQENFALSVANQSTRIIIAI